MFSQTILITKMFTKEHGKTFIIVLAAFLVGSAIYQKWVGPMITKK